MKFVEEKKGSKFSFSEGKRFKPVFEDEAPKFTIPKSEAEIRKSVELFGWEKKWEEINTKVKEALPFLDGNNPTTRAFRSIDPLGFGGTGLVQGLAAPATESREMTAQGFVLPFTKYALPSERKVFEQLSEGEKANSLAWESFGALLYALGPTVQAAKGPAKQLAIWNKARKMLKMEPVEDAVSSLTKEGGIWGGFDHFESVKREARNVLRTSKDEAEVLAQVMTGSDEVALKAFQYEQGLLNKKMSKAWEKIIEAPKSGTPYAKPKLAKEALDQLSYDNLQAKHFSTLYKTNMKRVMKDANMFKAENLMKQQAKKFYGDEMAEGLSFANTNEEEVANLIRALFTPKGKKLLVSHHKLGMGEYRLPWMRSEPHLYGMGEEVYQTKTKFFDKIKAAYANQSRYKFEKVGLLTQMLSNRGFGKIKKGKLGAEFVPNKDLWTRKNLRLTKELFVRVDNLAQAGRSGKVISKADASAAITKLMDDAKENTPIVAELVSVIRDHFDVLYKEGIQIGLPQAVRRMGLTAKGESIARNLDGIWMPKIEAAFKTNSGITYGDRVALVKEMLADYQKTLLKGVERRKTALGPGVEGFVERRNVASPARLPTDRREAMVNDLFLDSGKVLEKKLDGLKHSLTYNKGTPAYLEHYAPRLSQGTISASNRWKASLFGEASYKKMRRETFAKESNLSLQEMVEGRISAQARELFFTHQVDEAVEYAKRLPTAWKEHADFTLSRLLGQPSVWDDRLATVMQKALPGNWDAHRAMRAAQRVTGLQYTGLIGLRPFSAFRNLTQPIIMTPAELGGGVRDTYSLMHGLKLAGTEKHRAYMRQIGAITDAIPDFYRGPMLPQAGLARRYESMKDGFMWMFHKSDRINRYWSGGMAVDKWEHTAALINGGPANVSAFSRKLGLGKQDAWMRNEIENLLHLGRVEDAKAAYVRNIVANTQYLYTILDAPAMTGMGGIQKTVTSFNSWWMNYGTALTRWATLGTGTDKVKRMGTWLACSTAAEQILESWAGRSTAVRSTFLGPFPLGEVGTPPALEPLAQGMKTMARATDPSHLGDTKKRNAAVRSGMAALKSAATTFVPGGLMTKQAMRGWKEDEWAGLAKGIFQYNSKEDYEPLFGILE